MKGIIAKLNSLGAKLEENATDEQIVAAIDEFMKTPSTSSGTPESKETGKGLSKAVVDKLLAVGKKTGAVTDANEEAMRQLADEKPDLFASLIDPEKLGGASKGADDNLRISDLVKELRNQGPGAIAKKWDDLTDKERDDLYDSKPETYKAMYKEKFGVEYDKA